MPSRRENREAIQRSFQEYMKDFGPEAGDKIIKVMVDELGGIRITVPANSKCNGRPGLHNAVLSPDDAGIRSGLRGRDHEDILSWN